MFSTSSTATSVTEAPRRMFVPTWTWAKPTWPQPELSIGRELEALDGSHRCWETIGPVLDLAQKSIFPAVKALLEERQDYLTERERIKSPVTFEMYMTGRRKGEANPTLLFCCARVQPRKRAKEVVKASQILQDHPALRIAHSKRSPQARTPIRVFVGPMKGIEAGGVEAFGEVYCISPVNRTCGVPVFMRRKDGSFRKATIGGIVQFNDKYYGLTVAHTFVDDELESAEESEDDFSDLDCSFDSGDDLSAPDERESAARFEQPERHTDHSPREFLSFRTATLSQALQHIDDDLASDSIVGNLFQYSTHTGLDWALIEIDNSRVDPKMCNAITLTNEYEKRTLWPRALVTTGPAGREVLAITGDKGVIQGSMSRSSIYMRTAQTRGFQELWTVHMTSGLIEGDCGSWVVDRENGQLYGQIVAGHPGTGVGYLIPASQIFENVWQTLGDALILPSGLSSKSVAPLPPAPRDDPRRMEYSPISRSQTPPPFTSPISLVPSLQRKEIAAELEFIFSNENLIKDIKIRRYMDSQGFITLPVLISHPRMQNLETNAQFLQTVCKSLSFLETMSCKDGLDRVRLRHGWSEWVLPYEYRDESLRSSPRAHEDDYGAHPRLRDWDRKMDDMLGSIAPRSFSDDEYSKEDRYKEPSEFSARRKDSLRYLPRELPDSNDGKERESSTIGTSYEDPNDKAIARVLQQNEKDARRSEKQGSSPIDPSRPVYTKISRHHVSLETLRIHRIDYEIDLADPDYVLVKRQIPEHEREALWEHTRRIRSSKVPARSNNVRRGRGYQSLSASYSSSEYETDSEGKWVHVRRRVRRELMKPRKNSRRDSQKDLVTINDELRKVAPVATPPAVFPPTPATGSVASPDFQAHNPAIYQPGVALQPLPEGWISHMDEATGNRYYIHLPTETVQWEFPVLGSAPEPSQSLLPPSYDDRYGYSANNAQEVVPPGLQVAQPTFGINDEDPLKVAKVKDDPGPSRVPDSKKSRGSKSHASKSSAKGSTNASEIIPVASSSKTKSKDSNANPLLRFLAGGKKR